MYGVKINAELSFDDDGKHILAFQFDPKNAKEPLVIEFQRSTLELGVFLVLSIVFTLGLLVGVYVIA